MPSAIIPTSRMIGASEPVVPMPRRIRPLSGDFMGNFVLLRVFAVAIIIYGNDWMLSDQPGPGLWGVPFGEIGFDLLFGISGYLLTASWDRNPAPVRFAASRVVRVLPALGVSVLVTAFVIGPLCTTLRLRHYLLNGMTLRYLENAYLYRQLWLPGVFVGQPSAGMVNPVLWSLVAGALCCAALPVVASLTRQARIAAFVLVAVGCGSASLYLQNGVGGVPVHLFRVDLSDVLGVVPFFAVGALLRTFERDSPSLYRADFAMLGFAANWIVASWLGWWTVPVLWLTLPYMAVCFGRLSSVPMRALSVLGDPSYGLFLYAFPIQQAMHAWRPGDRYEIPTAIALTLGAAVLSWRYVERPALAWRYAIADRLFGAAATANP